MHDKQVNRYFVFIDSITTESFGVETLNTL